MNGAQREQTEASAGEGAGVRNALFLLILVIYRKPCCLEGMRLQTFDKLLLSGEHHFHVNSNISAFVFSSRPEVRGEEAGKHLRKKMRKGILPLNFHAFLPSLSVVRFVREEAL